MKRIQIQEVGVYPYGEEKSKSGDLLAVSAIVELPMVALLDVLRRKTLVRMQNFEEAEHTG